MNLKEVVVLAAKRTPIGSFQGALASVSATQLGAIAAKAAVEASGAKPEDFGEAYVGCVLPANLGQAPARQVVRGAGLPDALPCTTINKVCGSGLKTVMLGAQAIACGQADVVLAGGMESMSQSPYYLPNARQGFRMGDVKAVDSLVKDGLWDPYHDYHMGIAAELCATEKKITREMQDAFAIESYERTMKAQKEGRFKEEIVPVEVPQRRGDRIVVSEDEEPSRGNPAKIPSLRPAFKKDGTVTAANASSINDGAAMVVLASREYAEKNGLRPLATIIGHGSFAQAPEWFTTAPGHSILKELEKLELKAEDIDLWEVNEAFAVVSLAVQQIVGYDPAKVNVNGGAVALGHPIGASGTRIFVTLLHAMIQQDAKKGAASLCIGGGEAATVVVSR